MTDHPRSRSSGNDDTVVPLLMGALAVATVGPAVLTAARQWLMPRSDAVGLTIAEWWDRNWWLAAFWAVELVLLFAYLWWYKRRSRRRRVQVESVAAGFSRVFPEDWDPQRHLQVLRWQGHRPVRLRLLLSPRSPVADGRWRSSVVSTVRQVLGPTEPITWPSTPGGGLRAWGVRLPRLEIRVLADTPPAADRTTDTPSAELDDADAHGADRPSRRSPRQG